MKLVLALFSAVMSCIYMTIATNVQSIWTDQPESHTQFQELIWAFGSGVFFSITVMEIVLFIRENK